MTAHAAIKNTFLGNFSVQKCLTIILIGRRGVGNRRLAEGLVLAQILHTGCASCCFLYYF